MVDFYSALARKIQQVQDDPARMREVVYEAARLALRWQVAERGSLSNIADSRRLKTDLEEAIARLEAEATAPAAGEIDAASAATALVEDPAAPSTAAVPLAAEAGKPGAGPEQPSPEEPSAEAPRSPAGEAEKLPAISLAAAKPAEPADEPGKVSADLDAIRPGAIRPGAPIDLDEAAAAKTPPAQPARERVRPQRARDPSRPAYRVKPSEFANRDPRRSVRSGPGTAVLGIVIALQLVVGALAAAALYVALWGAALPS